MRPPTGSLRLEPEQLLRVVLRKGQGLGVSLDANVGREQAWHVGYDGTRLVHRTTQIPGIVRAYSHSALWMAANIYIPDLNR
jgi:hypothetical protein